MKNFNDLMRCRKQVFPNARRAPGTLLQVSGFARQGMLIEVDVTAAVAAK
jgi:enamine deaminase RidA (YjgF/YER057c/UK114 family)